VTSIASAEPCDYVGEPVPEAPLLRWLGQVEYREAWSRMQTFNEARSADSRDEIWFLEHAPVFTLGMNASSEHVLAPGTIPVVQTDRGGQVTYHGPGQLVVYPLLDVRRLRLAVRQLVQALESAVIGFAATRNVQAHARREAPGVYVGNCKLASIGLRIKRGCSYHGLALNVAMDREPFQRINPCGFAGMEVTDLAAWSVHVELPELARALAPLLLDALRLPANVEWARPEQTLLHSSR
jgi:lipoyl(octanoyl) transferase